MIESEADMVGASDVAQSDPEGKACGWTNPSLGGGTPRAPDVIDSTRMSSPFDVVKFDWGKTSGHRVRIPRIRLLGSFTSIKGLRNLVSRSSAQPVCFPMGHASLFGRVTGN